jgi:hypothetical protein
MRLSTSRTLYSPVRCIQIRNLFLLCQRIQTHGSVVFCTILDSMSTKPPSHVPMCSTHVCTHACCARTHRQACVIYVHVRTSAQARPRAREDETGRDRYQPASLSANLRIHVCAICQFTGASEFTGAPTGEFTCGFTRAQQSKHQSTSPATRAGERTGGFSRGFTRAPTGRYRYQPAHLSAIFGNLPLDLRTALVEVAAENIHIHTYIHTLMHTYIHTYIHIYIYAYVCIYAHTHT